MLDSPLLHATGRKDPPHILAGEDDDGDGDED